MKTETGQDRAATEVGECFELGAKAFPLAANAPDPTKVNRVNPSPRPRTSRTSVLRWLADSDSRPWPLCMGIPCVTPSSARPCPTSIHLHRHLPSSTPHALSTHPPQQSLRVQTVPALLQSLRCLHLTLRHSWIVGQNSLTTPLQAPVIRRFLL